MTYKFKEGDRVYWDGGSGFEPPETGVVVANTGGFKTRYTTIYYDKAKTRIWVKWDSDGKVLHADESALKLIDDVPANSFTEEQAVMFLLSKGYRIEKVS